MAQQFLLVFSCTDTHGIIAAVSTFLSKEGAFIHELSEYGDPITKKFFLRSQFEFAGTASTLSKNFENVGKGFKADWKFIEVSNRPKTFIFVSKFTHCLNDLLYRHASKRLDIDIEGVISNHTDAEKMVKDHGLTFIHFPVSGENKYEREILSLVEEKKIDLIVLARYMQILSPEVTEKMKGKIINIHHSFLPSFKGAKPYHQAFERGVKIIGATAHYVTEELDEGPIIEQEVLRVDHVRTIDELVSMGFDIEAQVLARAVKYHVQNRVFLNGSRTIIFK